MSDGAATAKAGAPAQGPADVYQQRAFGFWLYLMSDAIVFAMLFATYVVMVANTAGGPSGKTLFSLPNAFAETLLLLSSSLTFGFSTLATQAKQPARIVLWLAVTFALGAGFVGLEIREFSGLSAAGAGPGRSGFLSAFFTLVGTHGLHVGSGLVWIVVLAGQVACKGLSRPVASRLFRLGLFWHFLDIVWIGIFSIVYLPGVL